MDIEVSREAVALLPVTAGLLESLRESARVTATHYSTQIEGNRLTQEQVAIVSKGGTFPNRRRDEIEVRNYFVALDYVEHYEAISVGESHNYYLGRAKADFTDWVDYFCAGMAAAFSAVRIQASTFERKPDQQVLLRELDQRQKLVLAVFKEQRFVKTKEIAEVLNVQPRMALNICRDWVESGFLIAEGERKSRRYMSLRSGGWCCFELIADWKIAHSGMATRMSPLLGTDGQECPFYVCVLLQ